MDDDTASQKAKVLEAFRGYAKKGGASIFADDLLPKDGEEGNKVYKSREQRLGMNREEALALYDVSENPVFLWLCIHLSREASDIPEEAYEYLQDAALNVMVRYKHEVSFLERIRFDPEGEFPASIKRIKKPSLRLFKNFDFFGMNKPGKDIFVQASVDYRNYAVSCLVHQRARVEKIMSVADLYKVLAMMFGRISRRTGLSVEAIKAMDAKGKKVFRALKRRQSEKGSQDTS